MDSKTISWWHFYRLLRRRKLLLGSVVVFGMALTVLFTMQLPVLYRSTASALIENFGRGPSQEQIYAQDFSHAHKILAESRPVITQALELNGNPAMPESFEARTDAQLIYFIVIDADKKRSADLANCWTKAFIDEMTRRARAPVVVEKDFFDKSLPDLYNDWKTKQEQLSAYQKETNFDLASFETHPVRKRFEELSAQVTSKDIELSHLESELEALKKIKTPEDLLTLPRVNSDPVLKAYVQEVEQQRLKLLQARANFKSDSSEVKNADENLSSALTALRDAAAGLPNSVALSHDRLKIERDAIATMLKATEAEFDDLKTKANHLRILSAQLAIAEKAYTEMAKKQSENELQLRYNFSFARMWEQALEPNEPYKPNWRINLVIGFLLSFLSASALVYGLEQIDDTIRTPKDLERKLGVSVQCAVPRFQASITDPDGYLLVKRHGTSNIADSLRGLHMSLEVAHDALKTGKALAITITSAVPNDGKSFVASNLAILFASLGRKVLVVDADMRKASLSKALQVKGTHGFREIVKNGQWSREFAIDNNTPGYFLLSAGDSSESSESIRPDVVRRLVEQMKADFDVIIFDTPPVLALPDACVLGQASDVTVLVTRSRQTRIPQSERAAESLYSANIKELVFVVNAIDPEDAISDYGYGYGYGYGAGYGTGYGYGYGQRPGQSKNRSVQRVKTARALPPGSPDEEGRPRT